MEGDFSVHLQHLTTFHFNPLPPHGGRPDVFHAISAFSYFNPLPPHGGRLREFLFFRLIFVISIHSLRMEGDNRAVCADNVVSVISIHSLRMEGD